MKDRSDDPSQPRANALTTELHLATDLVQCHLQEYAKHNMAANWMITSTQSRWLCNLNWPPKLKQTSKLKYFKKKTFLKLKLKMTRVTLDFRKLIYKIRWHTFHQTEKWCELVRFNYPVYSDYFVEITSIDNNQHLNLSTHMYVYKSLWNWNLIREIVVHTIIDL